MNFITAIKNIIIYKEPDNRRRFELLEDEQEDMMSGKSDAGTEDEKPDKSDKSKEDSENVSKDLKKNLQKIKQGFHYPTNQDIIIREFKVMQKVNAFIIYVDGMVDENIVNDYILRQLMTEQDIYENTKISAEYIVENLLPINYITMYNGFNQVFKEILNGLTALFIEGCEECILIESRGYEKRSVTTPQAETVIKGPHEAFTENLRTNLTLVRKIIRNKELVTETMPFGKVANLTCAIMYIKGITNTKIIQEIKRRITSLDIDIIAGHGGLEQLIEDYPNSLFPQLLSTERPDKVADYLLYGKVAIICDGSPYVTLAPVTLFHFFQSPEDTVLRWQFGTFLKLIRWIAGGLAMFLPGLYIALTLFHSEMIPTSLLFSFARARENIPIPSLIELLIMETTFELIREAGLRVPGAIGQALGVIGAIVLGQAAVAAGLVSPILIMVVSITGLSSFAIPNYSMAFTIRLMRFVFIFFAAIAGLYGMTAGVFIFSGLTCSMKSFGAPYFSPVAPKTNASHDIGIVGPDWTLKERPDYLNTKDRNRTTRGVVRGWVRQDKRRKR